ncbi:E3 ubiquitin-protein ligase HUWE1 [Anabrus simplex]|uniref:E3 ubiquitin-protein ligase HUWE1 n=1 Tax=Anabrus simplex TaxID=316456 RepID=UPI0035A2A468
MKIDRSRLKKSTSEVPPECQALIEKLCTCSLPLEELREIDAWTFGKCELYHWIDVLDIFDKILEDASRPITPNNWILTCDLPEKSKEKALLLWVLNFTTLLIEHSFSRHLYNSMEHLIALLASCNMDIVLGVLNLLYMFSKRSNFITRLNNEKRQALIRRLTHLAETWGGLESDYSMADCCLNIPAGDYPPSSSVLHYEYYAEVPESNQTASGKCKNYSNSLTVLHIENLDKLNKTPAEIMNDIVEHYSVPKDKQIMLFTHIRLTVNFNNYPVRLLCVQARLQALSILAYSNALLENAHTLLYNGLLEELVEVVECQEPHLVEIRAAALRTLTSIIHLDRNPHFPKKPGSIFSTIVDVTGAASYHGILPAMVRSCINALVAPDESNQKSPFPLPLATALFSFLYHLASYEAGGEALVSCGMMESLLRVINWQGQELEHITFVTRAVRVIDLITNIEMQGFMSNGGLTSFINRLEMEVNICRKEQPFEIVDPDLPTHSASHMETSPDVASCSGPDRDLQDTTAGPSSHDVNCCDASNSMEVETVSAGHYLLDNSCDVNQVNIGASTSKDVRKCSIWIPDGGSDKLGNTCLPQRAALLKSMLNFLKKAIQDSSFPDSVRHVMDDSLPNSLRHIISNAEYYGPSLFLLATDVVTVYVFQEPSLLSSLQDSGLCNVVLHALLVKDVPATREVLGSLPNVFSALCLNSRGLESFVKYKPFKRLFKVLLSPAYLGAMRRRRSSDPIGDTASNLGNAMDELMRHQPTLKSEATCAIIQLLEELCELGRDPKYVCWRPQSKQDTSPVRVSRPSGNNEGGSSEEEDDDEEEASTSSHPQRDEADSTNLNERTPIPLIDYIVNVMKFVDAILSNNSTDDHCREFVAQNGLPPLMSILGLPNLPVDYPVHTAAQHVATVCKSILNLSHEPQVLKIGLMQLSVVLESLRPLHHPISNPGSSVLLHEVASAPNLDTAFNTAAATPLLHAMSAAHGYVVMFVHVCRTGQTDIRSLSISHWSSDLGLSVLRGLSKLYTSLVWESTLLLGICSEDIIPPDSKFGQADLDKLEALDTRGEGVTFTCHRDRGNPWTSLSNDTASNGTTSSMETDDRNDAEPKVDQGTVEKSKGRKLPTPVQLKYIKPLLGASSRLGRALAELFGLLVKLCVGSPTRHRRGQQISNTTTVPSPPARAVAGALTELLVNGLTVKSLPDTPINKFKLTFLICSVGFTSPMLFDEKKFPYYLMLQKFIQQGGHHAFFDAYQWAITGGYKFRQEDGIENPNLPEGTGEFLDAWLMLLEKLVNPKTILESPHSITVKQGIIYKAFDPWRYLLEMQRSAFESVMLMWDRTPLPEYGPRMAELMLAVLKHVLQGEQVAQEHITADMEKRRASGHTASSGESSSSTAAASAASVNTTTTSSTTTTTTSISSSSTAAVAATATSPSYATVNNQPYSDFIPAEEDLSTLMDMGFSHERAWAALARTCNMEQATNYLLDYKWLFHHTESLDDFTEAALSACLRLIDNVPDTVYRVCELLVTIAKRNGEKWRDNMLETLIIDIAFEVDYLLNAFKTGEEESQIVTVLTASINALSLATRIHLFTLLFEGPGFQEMHIPCALVVERSGVLPSLVKLLLETQKLMTACSNMPTPKWMAPLLLLLDLLEKVAVLSRRRDIMLKATNNVWRWFDLTTGGWIPYTAANNELLNEGYWNGESAVSLLCGRRRYVVHFGCWVDLEPALTSREKSLTGRESNTGSPGEWQVRYPHTTRRNSESAISLLCGRRRYVVHFGCMIQANEESGGRRPVTRSLICREKAEGKVYPSKSDKKAEKKFGKVENEDTSGSSDRKKLGCAITLGLIPTDAALVIRACVGLLAIPVDPDTLHAVMRVCLRLTRNFDNAKIFIGSGGVRLLLNLTQASFFQGYLTLSTLLIRHAIEEPYTLRQAVEKVIRTRTLRHLPPPYKEVLYFLRNTAACVCRDPRAYLEVAREILRVDLNFSLKSRNVEDDPRLILRSVPSKQNIPHIVQDDVSIQVIHDLLNALIQPSSYEDSGAGGAKEQDTSDKDKPRKSSLGGHNLSVAQNPIQLLGHIEGNSSHPSRSSNPLRLDMDEAYRGIGGSRRKSKDDNFTSDTSNEEGKKRPLLPKSAILKILAEAVRSYSGIAKLITEFSYTAGQSEMVTEDCSALAFLLDRLLPTNENLYDRECQSMARMLIASIASCNHSPDAQTALVCEVKAALLRSLAMGESSEKHTRIQHLAAIISLMIDNCPPLMSSPPGSSKIHHYGVMNTIVKVILRKGLLNDLARVSHYLDLSSPHIANSINSALKPLETLTRIVNQPTASSSKSGKVKSQGVTAEGITDHSGSSTSEGTHAQGEEIAEDTENTEHDISVAAEIMDHTSPVQGQDGVDYIIENEVSGLVDVMDHLLDREVVSSSGEDILSGSFGLVPEGEAGMESDDVVTPPVRNQEGMRFGNEDDAQDVDQVQSSDSESGSNASDDPDEEVNNVEDEEEEDDEDADQEDEEEGGSGYEEDGIEFFESDEFRMPALDRESEDVLMIQYSDPDLSSTNSPHVPWNTLNSIPLPFGTFEDPSNGNDIPALSHVPTNHPLLMARHHNLDPATVTSPRTLRGSRPRRYQYLQIGSPRTHNPTVILESPFRILGPGSHDLPVPMLQPLREGTRVVIMENENGILAEEENLDYMDHQEHSSYLFGPSLNATLNNIPTAMWWWCEEAKLLDGDSQADCAVAIATEIIESLEKHKAEEVSRNKERMRKKLQEESLKKGELKNEDKKNCEGEMDVAGTSAQISNSSPDDIISTADVASATENLAESIVESVIHNTPLHPPQISSGESEFSEVTTGLLNSLSDILPPVSQRQFTENVSLDPSTFISVQSVGHSGDSEPVSYSSDINVTPGTAGLDMTLVPSLPNTEVHLNSSVSRPITDVTLNSSASSSVMCLTPAPDLSNLDAPEEDFDNSDLLGDSLPPPLIPLEDVLLSNQSLRSGSSFRHNLGNSESQSSTRLIPSPSNSPNHTCGSAPPVVRNNQETAEFSGSQTSHYSDTQSSIRIPRNSEPIEPLDLEAAVSWLRHVDVRTNQHSNSEPQSSSGFNQSSSVQQTPTTSASDDTPEIPEGVDPSFLAALPDEMREEVIAEQLRLQRLRQRALQQSTDASPASVTEVNPEFLAALPPAIQEEVLAQQRLEQQRQAAASANPNDPVDAAAFFQNLPPSLRQAILTDMEDSQISVLPPDLAEEAQNLRREWEARNRQLMQERFFSHVTHNSSALSSILRNSGRVGSGVYGIHAVPQRAQWNPWNSSRPEQHSSANHISNSNLRLRGRLLLDHEALTCLLVMLFVDEPKLNTGRLHRVIRNLCYHAPTREWLVKTLLSIMDRCNTRSDCPTPQRPRRMSTRSQVQQAQHSPIATSTAPSWLNLTMDAALGLQASVFNIVRHPGKRASKSQETASITIHAQAAPIVFRHTLELMISLAKSFPGHFLPVKNLTKEHSGVKTRASTSTSISGFRNGRGDQTNFWEILLKLDSVNTSKKGKSVARTHSVSSSSNVDEEIRSSSFESSAFGQLVTMLASPVVKKSCMLTDKLLRLLSLISVGLPEMDPYVRTAENKKSEQKEESVPITEQHLKLAINVLTSKSCSEEGLEDATALLLNLSNCPDPTKDMILRLLLDGAMDLANMVNSCIAALMKELVAMNKQIRREETEEALVVERPKKGVLTDRFTHDSVVVTAPAKVKATCDLQLPSMSSLTTKTSSQAFFLRILKVIVQIRENVRMARNRQRENSDSLDILLGDSSTEEQISGTDERHPPAPDAAGGSTSIPLPPTEVEGQGQMPAPDQSQPQVPKETTAEVLGEGNRARPSKEDSQTPFPTLSDQLPLDHLWATLSACLLELAETPDHHAVLVLQPAVEAFFLVHSTAAEEQRMSSGNRYSNGQNAQSETVPASEVAVAQPNVTPVSPLQSDSEGGTNTQTSSSRNGYNWESSASSVANLPRDQQKFLKFAETHRTVLNQILRQSSAHLADGPFAVLVDHTRVLDFDVKRRYFRSELDRMDEGIRREELAVHVRRSHVFEDSFRELHRRGADEWKNRFYIVFEGEEGQDAGGLLREWYVIISREIFNPMYALFKISPGDRVTYMINSSSHCNPNHLCYFKFVGRVIAKAIYDNKLLECYFTRSFYKHILGIPVKYTDMESEDYSFYQGLVYLMEHDVRDLGYDLTFSAEVQEFGVTDIRDLIPNGRNIPVTEQTKMDYIRLVCQMKMTGAIRKQLNAFLEGFYDIIPKRLISIFNEQELELLISGMPNVDIEDLKANTEYHKYQPTSLQIQWFWKALRAFDQADRAKFLQFVTGTSKVPLQGFAALEGMNGVQKFQIHRDDRSTDRLPSAHTCFNQLDLPVYESFDKLRTYLLKAIHECSEGFGFA